MINSFSQCASGLDKSARLTTYFISIVLLVLLAALTVLTFGGALVVALIGWLIDLFVSDYNVRLVRASGARVTPEQFPEVHQAYEQVREQFGVREDIPIVVIEAASVNAMAVRFAQRKMIVLFSELVVAVKDSPAQMRFFMAHEMCHCVLDHGGRRFIELYKPAKFKRGRELTCDNAGLVASGNLIETHASLAKLAVGRHLWGQLKPEVAQQEAREIMSGLVGYFVGQYLTHPAVGDRLDNASAFAQANEVG